MTDNRKVASIKADTNGNRTIADALRAACRDGYTHATGSGTYWGTRIRKIDAWRDRG